MRSEQITPFDLLERQTKACERIAAALEILASPIKRDIERRVAMEAREQQVRASRLREKECRGMWVEI